MLQYRIELKPEDTDQPPQSRPDGLRPNRDRVLERYAKFQDAARLEKHWTNERLGWLFTPQSILFAAFGFTFTDKLDIDRTAVETIRHVIPWLGIANSAVVLLVVFAACWMHRKWTALMISSVEDYRKAGGDPKDLTFGSKPSWPAVLARWASLCFPVVFCVAWVVILSGSSSAKTGAAEGLSGASGYLVSGSATMKVYVASPLGFADSTKSFMKNELIPAISHAGAQPINPWDTDSDTDEKIRQVRAVMDLNKRKDKWQEIVTVLGRKNSDLIRKSDGVVAVLDGVDVDSGTAAEIGYASALGKWVIAYRSDFRRTGEDETSEANLQVEYFIRSNGGVVVHDLASLEKEVTKKLGNGG